MLRFLSYTNSVVKANYAKDRVTTECFYGHPE